MVDPGARNRSGAPRRLIANCAGLALRDPPLPIPGFVKMAAWSERTHHDPGHAWARALMFETAETLEKSVPNDIP